MKLSTMLISMVVVGMIVVTFSLFYANIAVNSGRTYDNNTFSSYDKLNSLGTQTLEINSQLQNATQSSSSLDIVGDFLRSGYKVIKITWSSFDTMTQMTSDGIDQIGASAPSAGFFTLKNGLIIIISIVFLFTVISILVGRDV